MALPAGSTAPQGGSMKKTDFNTGWTCRALKPGAEAIPVSLPHDAMRTESRVSTSLGEGNIGWFEGGDYEYRKLFTLDAGVSGTEKMSWSLLPAMPTSPTPAGIRVPVSSVRYGCGQVVKSTFPSMVYTLKLFRSVRQKSVSGSRPLFPVRYSSPF